VANAPGGSITVGAQGAVLPPLSRSARNLPADGAYVVRGLIPGRYAVTVFDETYTRVTSRPVPLVLTASATKSYSAGPRAGTYTVRFVSGAAPVIDIDGHAVDGRGDVAEVSTSGYGGTAVRDGLSAGTYRYDPASFRSGGSSDAPVQDGPWWFGGPTSAFTITAGRTTHDGTIALHVHAAL
jgi:hypothetical protein